MYVSKVTDVRAARLRWIMEARFGIGGCEALTLADIGKKLGVTRERIRQLESRALALLRQALYRLDPSSYPDTFTPLTAPRRRRSPQDETVFAVSPPTHSPPAITTERTGNGLSPSPAHGTGAGWRSFPVKRAALRKVVPREFSNVALPG